MIYLTEPNQKYKGGMQQLYDLDKSSLHNWRDGGG